MFLTNAVVSDVAFRARVEGARELGRSRGGAVGPVTRTEATYAFNPAEAQYDAYSAASARFRAATSARSGRRRVERERRRRRWVRAAPRAGRGSTAQRRADVVHDDVEVLRPSHGRELAVKQDRDPRVVARYALVARRGC